MNLALGMDQAIAPQEVNLIRGQDGVHLRDDGVASHHKGVGLVIVGYSPAADVEWTAVRGLDELGESLLLSEELGGRDQRRGQEHQRADYAGFN